MPRDIELGEDYCPNCGQYSGGESPCPNCGSILKNDDDEFAGFHDTDEDIDDDL